MAKTKEELREVRKQWFSELELKQQETCSKERLKVGGYQEAYAASRLAGSPKERLKVGGYQGMYGKAVGKDDITASMKRGKTFSAALEEKGRKEKEKKTEQNILKKIL